MVNSYLRNSLREIGEQLDRNQFPIVYNSGIVKPGDAAVVSLTPGEDINNVRSRTRGPATGSWERSAGWQRQTGQSGEASRPRPASEAAPIVSSGLYERYEAELDAVRVAYPGTKVWKEAEGLWLLTESTILPGLGKKATFLTALPYSSLVNQRSWGFWTTAISLEWIGPRHTNYPDGSVCAFEPKDGTWIPGDSILQLIDLYSLWALRHEHLRVFGRWPGHQAVHFSYERITELKDDEFCGCGNPNEKLYVDCCKQGDLENSSVKDALSIIRRQPPGKISNFMRQRDCPPSLSEVL
ncbi:hypothetical protein [Marinimicrobium sp. ABcell2]|uniref:hypothetical protein n=1 Tax=Marinimicrobium sp. ABcell2 TaxID=3069751 RepID=UPI0027B44FC3|nr:hypothetical protein [Marinimicrobium sp. ABcell2]MDQ2077113.1 hypothetical protein [Marinimicrobium sp. ABcell2]